VGSRVGGLPIQEFLPVGGGVGAGSAWRRHAPTLGTTPQPVRWPAAAIAITPSPWLVRRPPAATAARHGCVRGWGVGMGGRGGPGRPGGPRPGCGGSGAARPGEACSVQRHRAALGGPRVRGGRRWRPGCRGCGSTPTAAGCGGRRERWRPGPARWPAPPARSVHPGRPRRLEALPEQGSVAGGMSRSRPAAHR
jgi:hypothetical protein